MNITRETLADYHEKITISLAKEDYWGKVNQALKRYGKKASIKGFRPGKVPPAIIKKMHGTEIMHEEVNQMLAHKLQDFIKEEKLKVLGQPLAMGDAWPIMDIKFPSEYEFSYELGLSPDFDIPLLNDSDRVFTEYKVLANDENIDSEVEKLRKRHGLQNTLEEDAKAEDGDNLYLKFEEVFPKKMREQEDVREPIIRENIVATDMLTEKGQEALIGLAIGKSKKIDVFAAISKEKEEILRYILMVNEEEYPDLQKKFEVTLNKIARVTPAELDQDFFAKVLGIGEAETEADFRAKIKEEIEAANDYYTQQHLHNDFVNAVMESTSVNLPSDFLMKFFSATQEQPIPQAEFEKQFTQYQQATKWNLIRSKIATDKELKVENEELDGFIRSDVQRQLMQYAPQLLANPDSVDGFVNQMKGDRQYVEQAFMKILDDKIFASLNEILAKEEKVVSSEEYEKIVKEANEAQA